jgi:hypothetical protein
MYYRTIYSVIVKCQFSYTCHRLPLFPIITVRSLSNLSSIFRRVPGLGFIFKVFTFRPFSCTLSAVNLLFFSDSNFFALRLRYALLLDSLMRLTCRAPDRVKSKEQQQKQHLQEHQSFLHQRPLPTMSVIPSTPLSPTITQSLVTSPVQQTTPTTAASPPQAQFYSAPHPGTSLPPPAGIEPLSFTPPTTSSSALNKSDILKRIVKADNDGIKKKQRLENNAHHFKAIKGNVVPPPPLSKYKRPPPIIPNRPGERYPLGIPYFIF